MHCACLVENGRHVFFECTFSREVWAHIPQEYKWIHILALSLKTLLSLFSLQIVMRKLLLLQPVFGLFATPETGLNMIKIVQGDLPLRYKH